MTTKTAFLGLLLGASALGYGQTILYDKMSNAYSGNIIQSAWWSPDGSDYDVYTWDDFTLSADSTISEVWWRGGNAITGNGGISGFSIRFYESITGGFQPKITALPENETPADYLKGYDVSGTANETAIPGTILSEYHYALPTSLTLKANTKYWIKIVANMGTFPFWGPTQGTGAGSDGQCFRYFTGGPYFQYGSGDIAFQLRGTSTVPEPTGVATLLIGGAFALRRRFKRA
ncbi:MAG: PEP-CTERM sorting domain-containing protein [Armatimonadetes bacterium]|nr:PEP-CTERM sorting domain-containing protein [Armatimonadota bacterium]